MGKVHGGSEEVRRQGGKGGRTVRWQGRKVGW